ncbi:MAG: hypothetical protein IKP19_08180 [Oscillospiraceae bacterium]|nr:hypothetical protein [Oscillospiraceae bacterium]
MIKQKIGSTRKILQFESSYRAEGKKHLLPAGIVNRSERNAVPYDREAASFKLEVESMEESRDFPAMYRSLIGLLQPGPEWDREVRCLILRKLCTEAPRDGPTEKPHS